MKKDEPAKKPVDKNVSFKDNTKIQPQKDLLSKRTPKNLKQSGIQTPSKSKKVELKGDQFQAVEEILQDKHESLVKVINDIEEEFDKIKGQRDQLKRDEFEAEEQTGQALRIKE